MMWPKSWLVHFMNVVPMYVCALLCLQTPLKLVPWAERSTNWGFIAGDKYFKRYKKEHKCYLNLVLRVSRYVYVYVCYRPIHSLQSITKDMKITSPSLWLISVSWGSLCSHYIQAPSRSAGPLGSSQLITIFCVQRIWTWSSHMMKGEMYHNGSYCISIPHCYSIWLQI